MSKIARDWKVRFWKYVTFEPNTGCWFWTGAASNRYGVLGVGSRSKRATHLSYAIHNGCFPKGMILHRCDTPECVNPCHLQDGTAADNYWDMVEKKRNNALSRQLME